MSEHVRTEAAAGVLTIRLDRPEKRNALTSAMYDALTAALAHAGSDDAIRAVLVCGAPGAFSAGNDITEFLDFAERGALGPAVLGFLHALAAAEKPLVAAVDGLAVGVGTTMLLHCDLVYCTPTSTFRTPFVDLGLVPEAASSLLAPRRMGEAWAFELLCLGAPFDAARAREARLVNAVVPAEALIETARRAAQALAAKPAAALRASRALVRGDRIDVHARIEEEARLFAERLGSAEARAAFAAFLGKRG